MFSSKDTIGELSLSWLVSLKVKIACNSFNCFIICSLTAGELSPRSMFVAAVVKLSKPRTGRYSWLIFSSVTLTKINAVKNTAFNQIISCYCFHSEYISMKKWAGMTSFHKFIFSCKWLPSMLFYNYTCE